jgi:Bax protein
MRGILFLCIICRVGITQQSLRRNSKLRDHVRNLMIYVLLAALIAIVPIGIARHLLSTSRSDAFVPDRPNYLAHQYPPHGKAELTKKLAGLLNVELQKMHEVPRIYLARLPEILPTIYDTREKKRLFTSSMLPIILRANELIIADRGRLISILTKLENNRQLNKTERKWLSSTAKLYRVKLAKVPNADDIAKMLYKIDVVPVSLALAQAATESAWGTSRFAQHGNALFGEWVYGDNARGIIPAGRDEGKTHKIKSFDYLLDSVRSYMVNLNRHKSYSDLRRRRAELREHSLAVTGAALAPALVDYSQRGTAYVNEILSIIDYNDFEALDHALLVQS